MSRLPRQKFQRHVLSRLDRSRKLTGRSIGWLDRQYLRTRRGLKKRLGLLEPLRIDVYHSYAGPEHAVVRGRTLENELPRPPRQNDTLLDNVLRTLQQIESDEVPHMPLLVRFAGQEQRVRTDSEGYFFAEFSLGAPLAPGWAPVHVEVSDGSHDESVDAQGRILVPQPSARFGVISDIDDTILQSHVQNRWRQAAITMMGNAVTRLSFEGTADLYQGLRRSGRDAPFFYVSRSGWSIHAVLEHFIRHQGLPEGPLILRHVGVVSGRRQVKGHKKREILRIMQTFPRLPFVLIGDSGQHDPKIYGDLARHMPGRVQAVLIRNVSSQREKERIESFLHSCCPISCPRLVFDEDAEAARFAHEHDLWSPTEGDLEMSPVLTPEAARRRTRS